MKRITSLVVNAALVAATVAVPATSAMRSCTISQPVRTPDERDTPDPSRRAYTPLLLCIETAKLKTGSIMLNKHFNPQM